MGRYSPFISCPLHCPAQKNVTPISDGPGGAPNDHVHGGEGSECMREREGGFSAVEVLVALGISGVVITGLFSALEYSQRSSKAMNAASAANLATQQIASVVGDSARCASVFKAGHAAAEFPMGIETGAELEIPASRMNRLVSNGSDSNPARWITIAELGQARGAVRLTSLRMRAVGPRDPLGSGSVSRLFEVQFTFRLPQGAPLTDGLGSAEFKRTIGLRAISVASAADPDIDDPWRQIASCSIFQDRGQAACESMGHIWEAESSPPCRIQNLEIHNRVGGGSLARIRSTTSEYPHAELQLSRALGSSEEPQNLGVGNQGILGSITGTGYFGEDYHGVASMRFINRDAWSATSHPSNWELHVARRGWLNWWNSSGSPGVNPELTYQTGGTAQPAVRVTDDYTLEVGNEIHFGKSRRKTLPQSDAHPQVAGELPGGYIAVDGHDLEFGSRDTKFRHLSFFNRPLGAQVDPYLLDTSHGQIRVIGSKNVTFPKKPSLALVTQDVTDPNVPVLIEEVQNGQTYGPGRITIRQGGNNVASNHTRLILDGNLVGSPTAGKVLVARDESGAVEWRDNPASMRVFSGTGSHGAVLNIGAFTIPQCHFHISARDVRSSDWGKGLSAIEVYVQNDAGTPRVFCQYSMEEGPLNQNCVQPHATSWMAICAP